MRGRGGGNRGARAPAPYQRPVTMARGGFAPRGGRGGFPFAPARAQAFETPRDGGFFMHDDRETETAAAPVHARYTPVTRCNTPVTRCNTPERLPSLSRDHRA